MKPAAEAQVEPGTTPTAANHRSAEASGTPGTEARQGCDDKPQIADLIRAYGDAMFDCGQWDEEDAEGYAMVHGRAKTAEADLLAAITPSAGGDTTMTRLNNAVFVEQWERLCAILGIEKRSVIEVVDEVESRLRCTPSHVGEREALRAAQAEAVMPLIGNLLDQWESVPNDLKDHIREIQEGFEQAVDAIDDAMEGRGSTRSATEPTAWIATHESGGVLHLSAHDGWKVDVASADRTAIHEEFNRRLAASEEDLKEKLKPYEDGQKASDDLNIRTSSTRK